MEKHFYYASNADQDYHATISEARSGISYTEEGVTEGPGQDRPGRAEPIVLHNDPLRREHAIPKLRDTAEAVWDAGFFKLVA